MLNKTEKEPTLYDILGIKTYATAQEIKVSYRKLAKEFHPDTTKKEKDLAEAKMKDLNNAYEILSDSTKKKWYDRENYIDTTPPAPAPEPAPNKNTGPKLLKDELAQDIAANNVSAILNALNQYIRLKQQTQPHYNWQCDNNILDLIRGVILQGKKDIISLFIRSKFDLSRRVLSKKDKTHSNFVPLLTLAVETGNLEMVVLLVVHGAPVTRPKGERADHTAIAAAVHVGDINIVRYLLSEGANANAVDEYVGNNDTLLYLAIKNENTEIANELIAHGASLLKAYGRILENQQFHLIKPFFDYAVGFNIFYDLNSFLNEIEQNDLTGINFIGLTVKNAPVTRDLLEKKGINTAGILLTLRDLLELPDRTR